MICKLLKEQPPIAPVPDTYCYMLMEDYERKIREYTVKVPMGFIFDGASIPKLAQIFSFTPFAARIMPIALIHDWLYTCHHLKGGQKIKQDTADDIQEYLCEEFNIPGSLTRAINRTTRVLGRIYWKKDNKHRKIMCIVKHCNKNARNNPSEYGIPQIDCSDLPAGGVTIEYIKKLFPFPLKKNEIEQLLQKIDSELKAVQDVTLSQSKNTE